MAGSSTIQTTGLAFLRYATSRPNEMTGTLNMLHQHSTTVVLGCWIPLFYVRIPVSPIFTWDYTPKSIKINIFKTSPQTTQNCFRVILLIVYYFFCFRDSGVVWAIVMRVLLRLLTGSLTIFEQTAINYSNHTVINNYAKQIVKKNRILHFFAYKAKNSRHNSNS